MRGVPSRSGFTAVRPGDFVVARVSLETCKPLGRLSGLVRIERIAFLTWNAETERRDENDDAERFFNFFFFKRFSNETITDRLVVSVLQGKTVVGRETNAFYRILRTVVWVDIFQRADGVVENVKNAVKFFVGF